MPNRARRDIAESSPYNPLDLESLALSVSLTLEAQPVVKLGEVGGFRGVGIYALYYDGPSAPYTDLVQANRRKAIVPIYVGKAVNKGTRKGAGVLDDPSSLALSSRLRKHASSISSVKSLSLSDFSVRYLRTYAVFVPLCESAVIGLYQPVWNVTLDGFGNNAQGSGRDNQVRSEWDTVHPGRDYAMKLRPNPRSSAQLIVEVKSRLAETLLQPNVVKRLSSA